MVFLQSALVNLTKEVIESVVWTVGRTGDEAVKKATLVSNLSRYVRYGDTFNRPAPNVFGLIDFSRDIEANPPLEWSDPMPNDASSARFRQV